MNEWEERDSFEKRAGKYDLVLMDYSAKDEVGYAQCTLYSV